MQGFGATLLGGNPVNALAAAGQSQTPSSTFGATLTGSQGGASMMAPTPAADQSGTLTGFNALGAAGSQPITAPPQPSNVYTPFIDHMMGNGYGSGLPSNNAPPPQQNNNSLFGDSNNGGIGSYLGLSAGGIGMPALNVNPSLVGMYSGGRSFY